MYGYARGSGYPLVTFENDTAPLTIMSLRVFPSAAAYLAIPPDGRAQMDVALSGAAPDITFALATLTGNTVSAPIVADSSLRVTAATAGVNQLLVVVANTAQSGASEKPSLCAGAPDEVDACLAQFAPPKAPSQAGGGCDVSGRGTAPQLWFLGLLLLACRRLR
jgi:hypothetical protein